MLARKSKKLIFVIQVFYVALIKRFISLSKIKKDINTGEYLFTNIFNYLFSKKPIKILTYSEDELMGINDRKQLSYAEIIAKLNYIT